MFLKSKITSEQILFGNIQKTLLIMTIPTAIALSLNLAFNFIDRLYISGVGEVEFAALGMAFLIQGVIVALGTGIGTGVSTCLAKAIGAGDNKTCNDIGRTAVLFVIFASILTVLVGIISLPLQVSALGMSETIKDHYQIYIMIISMGSYSIYAPLIFNSILRGEGNMTIPMHVMVVGASANLILDPILIFGLGAIPAMGVKGAAIATISARTLATVWVIWAVCKHSQHVTVFKELLSIKKLFGYDTSLNFVSKKVISAGLPISISTMITPMVLGTYYRMLTPYGDMSKVALTVGITYLIPMLFPIAGLSRSVNTMCSQNLGASNFQRSENIYKQALTISFVLVSVLSFFFVFFDDFFISAFMSSKEVSQSIKFAILCFAISYPLNAVFSIQSSYLVSNSLSQKVLFINGLSVLYCGLTYVFQLYFGEGGVWVGMVMSILISVVHAFFVIHFYINKKMKLPHQCKST